jgi:hypothetical protein
MKIPFIERTNRCKFRYGIDCNEIHGHKATVSSERQSKPGRMRRDGSELVRLYANCWNFYVLIHCAMNWFDLPYIGILTGKFQLKYICPELLQQSVTISCTDD